MIDREHGAETIADTDIIRLRTAKHSLSTAYWELRDIEHDAYTASASEAARSAREVIGRVIVSIPDDRIKAEAYSVYDRLREMEDA
jgi:hypothetical protein